MSETITRNTSEATITTPWERKPTMWTAVHSQDAELEKGGAAVITQHPHHVLWALGKHHKRRLIQTIPSVGFPCLYFEISIINYICSSGRWRKLLRGLPLFGFQTNQLVRFKQGSLFYGYIQGKETPGDNPLQGQACYSSKINTVGREGEDRTDGGGGVRGASQVYYLISVTPSEASRLTTMKLGREAGPCVCPLDATHPALCRAVITAAAARVAADTAENMRVFFFFWTCGF